MKNLIILFIVLIGFETINAQQIKDLKYYYSDKINYNPTELSLTRKYYKDINNFFTPFIGQWKSIIGTQTLIITLWKKTKEPTFWGHLEPIFYCDEINGHYDIYADYGLPTESLLFTSRINIGNTNQVWETVILAKSTTSNELSGMILDVNGTPLNPIKYPQGVTGFLSITINNGTSPLSAQWKITKSRGFTRGVQPKNFIVPINTTLVKI